MQGQQKHQRSSEGLRGAMTHRVSSYTSRRCSDWSCGEQNDWVTTYHKTTPNQFWIKLAVSPISVTHSLYMLHSCGARWMSRNKMYRTDPARCSPDLSLLYSDWINFTSSRELVEPHQQLLNFPSAHKMKIIFTFLPQSDSAKVQPPMQDNGAQSHLSIFFFFFFLFNNITFQSTINIRCIWQNIF